MESVETYSVDDGSLRIDLLKVHEMTGPFFWCSPEPIGKGETVDEYTERVSALRAALVAVGFEVTSSRTAGDVTVWLLCEVSDSEAGW